MYKVVVGLAIVSTCVQTALADPKESFKEPATGIVFPASLGKWNRGKDRNFLGSVNEMRQFIRRNFPRHLTITSSHDAIPDVRPRRSAAQLELDLL